MAYVRVDLLDVNDNRPSFYPLQYAVSLSTQSAPGTSVVKVTAHDPDAGVNGRVTYRTVPGGGSPFFTLNKDTGGWPRPVCERVRAVLTAPAVEKNSFFLYGVTSTITRRALPCVETLTLSARALLKTLRWLHFCSQCR